MTKFPTIQTRKIRTGLLVIFCCLVSGGIFHSRLSPRSFVVNAQTAVTPRPKSKAKKQLQKQTPKAKYSEFPHGVHTETLKLGCNSCHTFPSANWKTARKTEAFPDVTEYPRHESCLNCHRQQFFSGTTPTICSVCHTNPSPNDSSRHPFQNPRETFDQSPKGKTAASGFRVSFPHDKHTDIVSEIKPEKMLKGSMFVNARLKPAGEEESCSVCHQTYKPQGDSDDEYVTKPPEKLGDGYWLKKGTFKTVPTGHTICFTCHSQDTGIMPAPDDCAVCHKLAGEGPRTDFDEERASTMGITDKIILTSWQKRDSSATFRHEWFSHVELKCANCHNAAGINTLDAQTKKVKASSCSGCHITASSDDGGILNIEIDSRKKDAKFECVKCHIAFGKSPIPDSHFLAISEK